MREVLAALAERAHERDHHPQILVCLSYPLDGFYLQVQEITHLSGDLPAGQRTLFDCLAECAAEGSLHVEAAGGG